MGKVDESIFHSLDRHSISAEASGLSLGMKIGLEPVIQEDSVAYYAWCGI